MILRMSSLKEHILKIVPEAEVSEGEVPVVNVSPGAFRTLAIHLREDAGLQFDYLVCMTGMDFGENLGVYYRFRSTVLRQELTVRVETVNREQPELMTVADLWATAELNEREVFDFFGIRFINHPDMRRLFLRNDWVGHPLRKDYDPALNDVRLHSDETLDTAPVLEVTEEGVVEEKENVVFGDSEYVVNIGPQHPATHGVLRFRVSLEGEMVKKVDVNCGYIHRGIEKMCESMTYPQTLALTDRLDYLSAHQNRHALCRCIEQAMGLEVPERAQYGRADTGGVPSVVLVYVLYGPGGFDGFFLWFPRPGKDTEFVGGDLRGAVDNELQCDRRGYGGYSSPFCGGGEGVYPVFAGSDEGVSRDIYRECHCPAEDAGHWGFIPG